MNALSKRTSGVMGAVMLAVAAVAAHPMTYKGTVVSVAEATVQVKGVDDMTQKVSTQTFKVTDKTRVYRGDALTTFAAAKVKKDERIAVTINMDQAPDIALEIRLAPAK